MNTVSTYDHLRPVDGDYPEGVYRVVGVGDGTVTAVRVADPDGRRRHTGELITVERADMADFEGVEDPPEDRSEGSVGTAFLARTYWTFRAFAHELVVAPVPTAVATLLILAGSLEAVPVPDEVRGGLIVVGSLSVALVGSGFYRRIR